MLESSDILGGSFDSEGERGASPSPNGRTSIASFRSTGVDSESAQLFVEQDMRDLLVDMLDSGLARRQPEVKDDEFIGDVYRRISREGAPFSADDLRGFMQDTLGLPEEDLDAVKSVMREIGGRGDDVRVPLESFSSWWHDTALTVGAADAMSAADDFRRSLRLLGLFSTARDALLSNLPVTGEVGEEADEEASVEDAELRELFQRCDTERTKHLQICDIVRVALDLGLLLTVDQLKDLLRELDLSHSNRVGFVEFKAWWEADAERTWFASASLRRRLRLCGLLMNTSRSVLDVFQLGMDISDDERLAELVDGALDVVMQKGTRKQVVDLLHDGIDPEGDEAGELQGMALGLIPADSALRRGAYQLTSTQTRGDLGWWFEGTMTMLIIFNLLVLILAGGETGTVGRAQLEQAASVNMVVGVIFTFEVALEIVARGFWLESSRTYLREDGANLFDFLIIMTMWVLYALPERWVPDNVSFAVVAMRGFHVLKYFDGVKEIIGSILHGSEALWLVGELMILAFIIFATLGRELFGGSSSMCCSQPSNSTPEGVCPLNFECDPCYEIAQLTGPRLRPLHYDKFGFDSFSVATVSVFSAASLDEWATIAQPIRAGDSEMNFLVWPFFMILVLILNLVGVNLFLAGVTFSYMTVRKAKHTHDAMHKAYEMLVEKLVNAGATRRVKQGESTDRVAELSTFEMDEGGVERKSGAQRLMEMKAFDLGVTVAVIINICCLAVIHHDMDPGLADALEFLDYVFTSIYVFEAGVKIVAMGFGPYWQVKMNRLDFIICVSALVGYAISFLNVNLESLRIVRIMRIARAARALRVGKVVLKFERTKHMLAMAFGHIDTAINLLFLITFWMVVFGVVAMYLFSTCSAEDRLNRGGFKDFWSASMTNFQILSGDDWAWVMYEYMDCAQTPEIVAIYFVFMHTSSAFIMVNLFVAIFLENFQLSDEDKRQKQIDAYIQKEVLEHADESISLAEIKAVGMLVDVMYSGSALLKRAPIPVLSGLRSNGKPDDKSLELDKPRDAAPQGSMFESEAEPGDAKVAPETYLCGTADSSFRQLLRRIVEPKEGTNWFHRFIELAIVLSGCAIAIEGPTGEGSLGCLNGLEDLDNNGEVDPWLPQLLKIADFTFYGIFLTECAFMIAAFGLYSNEHAYLRTHRAHWFDLFVVVVTSVDVVLQMTMESDSTGMKIIRLLRVLRLLRLLEDIPAMALMAEAIEHSMIAVSGLVGLLMGSVAMFGIVGVSLFMGMFYHCAPEPYVAASFHNNATILRLGKEDCEAQGFVWQNLFFTFDSLPDALSTLFICMTRQGWMELFYAAVDTTEHESAPLMEDNYISATVFFVLFVMINAFLLEQLFVGILVDVFSQSSGHALLTETQKNWQYVHMCVDHIASKAKTLPTTPLAVRCQDLMHASKVQILGHRVPVFNLVLNTIIVFNVVALILNPAMNPTHNAGERSDDTIYYDHFNMVCVVLYTIEVGFKLVAYGFRQYVATDTMDFLVVVVMWPVAIHAYLQHHQPDVYAHDASTDWIQGLQIVRVFRTFDLINSSNRLRKLIQTIRLSIPHVQNLGMLMFLTYSVFAVCAMKLLGTIQLDHPDNKIISEYANFGGFWNSFMLLFQVTTGQPLPTLIIDSACSPRLDATPDCTQGGSGETGTVMLFLSTFYIISNFVFLNLFIALLLENFEYNWSADFIVNEEDVHGFKDKWLKSTDSRDASKPLPLCDVRAFVEQLGGTFQALVRADPFWFNRLLLELDLTMDDLIFDTRRAEAAASAAAIAQAAAAKDNAGSSPGSFESEQQVEADATTDATAGANPRHLIKFHELLLALSRMRFGNRCLEFDREVDAEHKVQQKHEADARRIMSICASAWKMARNPPAHIVTESDHKRWRAAVGVARLWVLKSAIKTIRVSNQRTWQHRQIDDVIGEALQRRQAEDLASPKRGGGGGGGRGRSSSPTREAPNGNGNGVGGDGGEDEDEDVPSGGVTRKSTVSFGDVS